MLTVLIKKVSNFFYLTPNPPIALGGLSVLREINIDKMKKGMIFDLYQDGQPTKRVMAINEKDVMDLENGKLIFDIDFETEVAEILIHNIFEF